MRMTMSNGRRGAPLYTARVQRFRWLFVGRRAGDAAVPAYGPEALAEQVLLLLGGTWVAVRMSGQHNPAAQVAARGLTGATAEPGAGRAAPERPVGLDRNRLAGLPSTWRDTARQHVERRRATCALGM